MRYYQPVRHARCSVEGMRFFPSFLVFLVCFQISFSSLSPLSPERSVNEMRAVSLLFLMAGLNNGYFIYVISLFCICICIVPIIAE
jgi:hypothetical protein